MFFDAMCAMCWFLPDRRTIDSAGGLILLPIMVIVLGPLMIAHVLRRLATVRLLRSGVVAYATLRDRVQIAPAGGNHPAIERLDFTFEHRGRTYDVTTDVTEAEGRPIVDDPREQVVFWPGEVPRVVFIDVLPGRPRIREDNTIDPRNHLLGGVTAAVLLVAAALVNAFGAFLWLR